MGNYTSSFGVYRAVGRGEGRDELYDVSAKPALGMHKFLEAVVNEKGPVANKGEEYGRDGAYVPAGSVISNATLFINKAGSAANVKIDMVKKDGTDAKALLAAVASPTDGSVNEAAGAVIGTLLAEDRYFKVSGTLTGLDAVLKLEYI